jgi:hypothetical protein
VRAGEGTWRQESCGLTLMLAANHRRKDGLRGEHAQLVASHLEHEVLETDEFFGGSSQRSLTGLPGEPPIGAAALHIRGGEIQRFEALAVPGV